MNAIMQRYWTRLEQMVRVHMDPRLTGRFDPADIVQDTLLEAHRRMAEYTRTRRVPMYVWLRNLAYQRMMQLHRDNLMAERRAVRREVPLAAKRRPAG